MESGNYGDPPNMRRWAIQVRWLLQCGVTAIKVYNGACAVLQVCRLLLLWLKGLRCVFAVSVLALPCYGPRGGRVREPRVCASHRHVLCGPYSCSSFIGRVGLQLLAAGAPAAARAFSPCPESSTPGPSRWPPPLPLHSGPCTLSPASPLPYPVHAARHTLTTPARLRFTLLPRPWPPGGRLGDVCCVCAPDRGCGGVAGPEPAGGSSKGAGPRLHWPAAP